MSQELYDEIDLEDGAKELIQARSKIIVLKIKTKDGKNDLVLAPLRGMGSAIEDELLTLELELPEAQALEFLLDIRSGGTGIYGIDMHWRQDVVTILKESDERYSIQKVNIYDVSVESEASTLVIVLNDAFH